MVSVITSKDERGVERKFRLSELVKLKLDRRYGEDMAAETLAQAVKVKAPVRADSTIELIAANFKGFGNLVKDLSSSPDDERNDL